MQPIRKNGIVHEGELTCAPAIGSPEKLRRPRPVANLPAPSSCRRARRRNFAFFRGGGALGLLGGEVRGIPALQEPGGTPPVLFFLPALRMLRRASTSAFCWARSQGRAKLGIAPARAEDGDAVAADVLGGDPPAAAVGDQGQDFPPFACVGVGNKGVGSLCFGSLRLEFRFPRPTVRTKGRLKRKQRGRESLFRFIAA